MKLRSRNHRLRQAQAARARMENEAEVGPERGHGMVGVGKAWSALWLDIAGYCVKTSITGRMACRAMKWAAVQGWAIAHRYLNRLKSLYYNHSPIWNEVRRALRFLYPDTWKNKKQGKSVVDGEKVELREDDRRDGRGPVETRRDVEKIGLRVYNSDPDTITPFVLVTIPPGYSGYGSEDILRYGSTPAGKNRTFPVRAFDDPGVDGMSHHSAINIANEKKLHGWYSAHTCQPPLLLVVLHEVNANVDADQSCQYTPPVVIRHDSPLIVSRLRRSLKQSWTYQSQIRKSKTLGIRELACRNSIKLLRSGSLKAADICIASSITGTYDTDEDDNDAQDDGGGKGRKVDRPTSGNRLEDSILGGQSSGRKFRSAETVEEIKGFEKDKYKVMDHRKQWEGRWDTMTWRDEFRLSEAEEVMVRFFGKRKVGELDKQCWLVEKKLADLARGQIFRLRMGEVLRICWRR
ncbi:hypothetical protein Q9L58_010517 [Maublancomyces gigas]|uniref:Uncharacterized protein n=1 Tax=Discina gigas TaxID=1032678 RepID=A0ABR3G3V1_9PEZI